VIGDAPPLALEAGEALGDLGQKEVRVALQAFEECVLFLAWRAAH
jgi:hypothetical protein